MIFHCKFVPLYALLLGPANLKLRCRMDLISEKTIVCSFVMCFSSVNSFATSLPRVEGDMVLFLCFSFVVSNFMGTSLLDYEVREKESIQS